MGGDQQDPVLRCSSEGVVGGTKKERTWAARATGRGLGSGPVEDEPAWSHLEDELLISGRSGVREIREIRLPGNPGDPVSRKRRILRGHCCAAIASFNTNWYQFEPK